jgi:ABC-type sugar transport system permease subunit
VFKWDGWIEETRIGVGLDNYIELLTADKWFLASIKNNLIWFVVSVGAGLVIGFTAAYMLNRKIKLRDFYRTAIFLPLTTSAVVVAFAWDHIYEPNLGLFNTILRPLGIEQQFLGDYKTALFWIILAAVWHSAGFSMVIYLAGLQTIPSELIDAALVDGANVLQRIWHVVIPMLWPSTAALLIFGAIGSVRTFEYVFILTDGGPFHATEVIALTIYHEAFRHQRTGYASAAAVVLLTVAMIITYFQLRMYKGAHQA